MWKSLNRSTRKAWSQTYRFVTSEVLSTQEDWLVSAKIVILAFSSLYTIIGIRGSDPKRCSILVCLNVIVSVWQALLDKGIQSLAVVFLHSYTYPVHEQVMDCFYLLILLFVTECWHRVLWSSADCFGCTTAIQGALWIRVWSVFWEFVQFEAIRQTGQLCTTFKTSIRCPHWFDQRFGLLG